MQNTHKVRIEQKAISTQVSRGSLGVEMDARLPVHKPGGIERKGVSSDAGHPVGGPQRLAPEVPRDNGGHHEAQRHHGWNVVFVLVVHHGVGWKGW